MTAIEAPIRDDRLTIVPANEASWDVLELEVVELADLPRVEAGRQQDSRLPHRDRVGSSVHGSDRQLLPTNEADNSRSRVEGDGGGIR